MVGQSLMSAARSLSRGRDYKKHEAEIAFSATLTAPHSFSAPKFHVGSRKQNKLTFNLTQKVFPSGDVSKEVSDTKRAVIKSKQPNILGTETKEWNASTIADQKIQKDTKDLKRQLLKVRAGLLDEIANKKTPKNHDDETIADLQRHIVNVTGEGPIGKCTKSWFNAVDERGLCNHFTADHWPDWNHSIATHTKEDVKQGQQVFEEKDERRKRMAVKEPKLNAEAYVDPLKAIVSVNDRLRERKVDYQDLKEQFKRELKVEFPSASEERLQAMAQRLLNEKLLADEKMARFPVQNESFRPNVALTTQDRRYKEFNHAGTYAWSDTEQRCAWTCCLNFGEQSRGCEHKVINPDAWCTLGFERRPGMACAGRAH